MKHFLGMLAAFFFAANLAFAQSLFFSIPEKRVTVGERFTVDVEVESRIAPINAISGTLSFSESSVRVVSISKAGSIVNLWTQDPTIGRGSVLFEGIILNPGFQGSSGLIFRATFEAKTSGTAVFNFSKGAILANDGRGTNILAALGSANFNILAGSLPPEEGVARIPSSRLAALPVITEYSASILSKESAYLKGKGEPNALTKIVFKDVSFKSIGEQFIAFLQTKRKKLDAVLVKNDPAGQFQYESGAGLVAGVYNATPFLVDSDSNTEKPGLGVQLLVSDSKIVKALVILINILGLLIPIVGLGVVIYFIPWYSFKRMRVLGKKLGLEEEKLDISGKQMERHYNMSDKIEKLIRKDGQT